VDKDIDIWKQRNEILHKKVNRQMDEIKDLNEKSETIFDLARKYPNKTYKELEGYRDADRQEEAQQIPLSESQKKQEELEPIEGEEQDNPELFDWKEKYNKEHKLRQEAETETILVKGIGINSPEMRDAKKKIEELQGSLERARKENNDLYSRLADALEVNESHQRLNGKLQVRLSEVEEDNKKISKQVDDQVNRLRKAGL
tara:strand:- start:19 stop:621 length:603 start_codon:yes stop_codon:yes gene_type:complete